MDNTEYDFIVPELWSPDMVAGLYQRPSMANRVVRVDGEVAAYGDILHLPALPQLTVSAVTAATGVVTFTDYTPSEAQLTVDKWYAVAFEVVKKASRQSKINLVEAIKRDSPRALMAQAETDLLALQSDVTTRTEGDSNSNVSEDLLTLAIRDLLNADLGPDLEDGKATFVFHTSQYPYFKTVAGFKDASITGDGKGGIQTLGVRSAYGIPIFLNSQVASSGGARKNLLFVTEAFALGVQTNIEFTDMVATAKAFSRGYAADWLYGVKTRLEGRAVNISTKA